MRPKLKLWREEIRGFSWKIGCGNRPWDDCRVRLVRPLDGSRRLSAPSLRGDSLSDLWEYAGRLAFGARRFCGCIHPAAAGDGPPSTRPDCPARRMAEGTETAANGVGTGSSLWRHRLCGRIELGVCSLAGRRVK